MHTVSPSGTETHNRHETLWGDELMLECLQVESMVEI